MVYHDNAAWLTRDNTWKTWPLRISIFYSVTWPPICRPKVNFKVHWSSRGHYKYIINIAKLPSSADGRLLYIHPVFASGGGDVTINFVSIKPSIKVNTVHITYFGAQVTPEGPRGPIKTPWEPLKGPGDHLRG